MTARFPALALPLALAALLSGAAPMPAARADAPAPTAPVPAAPAAGDKATPAQADVAAKTAFGTVAASDKMVGSALDAKALPDALKLVGKPGAFQGTVSAAYAPRTHSVVTLDFAPNYHDALTASVKPDAYAKFPNLKTLVGKHVLVSGKFTLNSHGVAQIEMTAPDQVKVIK